MMRINNIKQRMMYLIRLALSVIGLIVLSALPSASAGQQLPFPASGDLVLEMAVHDEQPTHYYIPSTGSYWVEFFEFKRLANWRRPPDLASDIGAIHLDYCRQGDAVRIDARVIIGPVDLTICKPVDKDRVKSAGAYVIRAGESASLQELARFGIEPINVKVVRAESHTLKPAEIANKTTAIEVVRVDQVMEWFRIVLKNLSAKNMVTGRVECAGMTTSFGPLAPGQVREVLLEVNGIYLRLPQGKTPNQPMPPKVVVTSAIFEDLTFEGNLEPALTYIAHRRAIKIQTSRILDLLQAAIESPEQDSGQLLVTLRQQLSALIAAPDIQVLNDLAERFGPFTQYQRNVLLAALKDGLSDTREGALTRMLVYEKNEAPKGTSLQSWLTKMKSYYEEEIKKL